MVLWSISEAHVAQHVSSHPPSSSSSSYSSRVREPLVSWEEGRFEEGGRREMGGGEGGGV